MITLKIYPFNKISLVNVRNAKREGLVIGSYYDLIVIDPWHIVDAATEINMNDLKNIDFKTGLWHCPGY